MPDRLPERGKSDEEDRIAKIQRRGKVQDREKIQEGMQGAAKREWRCHSGWDTAIPRVQSEVLPLPEENLQTKPGTTYTPEA